jgi:rhamnose transport system ATP-binding protein
VTPLLRAIGVTKSFGGVRALKGVSFDLCAGEVHALVGENGAGKSTLIKVLTGAIQPDGGEVILDGRRIEHNDPFLARSLGIAAIYQQPALFPHLSVAENIAISKDSGKPWRRISWPDRISHARKLLTTVGAKISADAPVSSLTAPEQQLVELAKALDADARIIIMDEPTASLGQHDTENLFRLVDELKERGVAIVYITHRFEELFRLAGRVTVLRDGNSIDTRSMEGVTTHELIRMMVGRELDLVFPKREITLGETALEVKHLSHRETGVRDVSLTVRRGEVLGLAGLIGSGRTQFAEALFGLTQPDGGEVLIQGRPAQIQSPADALALGLAYVPEDRRRHGVVMEMPVGQNTTLASLRTISSNGFLQFGKERQVAQDYCTRLGVKTPSIDVPVKNLSGGNQQKVSLARWLITQPKILILDEPTQGIDVGAKAEIYHLIGDLAAKGLAILMISSELPEILGMSDRVAVMSKGRIAAVLDRSEADPHNVMELALGHRVPSGGAA